MREFLYGVFFGAVVAYLYLVYGDELHSARRYTLQWRDWAVSQSDGYAAGKDTKK